MQTSTSVPSPLGEEDSSNKTMPEEARSLSYLCRVAFAPSSCLQKTTSLSSRLPLDEIKMQGPRVQGQQASLRMGYHPKDKVRPSVPAQGFFPYFDFRNMGTHLPDRRLKGPIMCPSEKPIKYCELEVQ